MAGQFYLKVLVPFLQDTARPCEPQRRKRNPVPAFRRQLSRWGDKGRDGKSEKEELSREQGRWRELLDSLSPPIPASFLFPALLSVLTFSTQPLLILSSSQARDLPKARVSPGQLLYSLASAVWHILLKHCGLTQQWIFLTFHDFSGSGMEEWPDGVVVDQGSYEAVRRSPGVPESLDLGWRSPYPRWCITGLASWCQLLSGGHFLSGRALYRVFVAWWLDSPRASKPRHCRWILYLWTTREAPDFWGEAVKRITFTWILLSWLHFLSMPFLRHEPPGMTRFQVEEN